MLLQSLIRGSLIRRQFCGVSRGWASVTWDRGIRRHGGFGRGYVLRRYGVLRGAGAPRALATETIVVLGDLAISRDLAALRGRLDGWRAAGGAPRRRAPAAAIDATIGFRRSLALRRGVYGRRAA